MARSPAQNQRLRDERRDQILSFALKEFVAKGYTATRIADIAQGTQIAQGLLYHYFPSKEALYVELVRHAFDGMAQACRALEAMPLTPREKIRTAITELLRLIQTREDFATHFMLTTQVGLSSAIPKEATAILRQHRAYPYEVIERILRDGQADGDVVSEDAAQLANVFWATIKGIATQRAVLGKKGKPIPPELLMRLFFKDHSKC